MHLLHRLPVDTGFHPGQSSEDASGLLLDVLRQAAAVEDGFDLSQVASVQMFMYDHIYFGRTEAVLADLVCLQLELVTQAQ